MSKEIYVRRTSRPTIILLLVALIAVSIWAWQQRGRADEAEGKLGLDAGRVLSAVFTQARDLRVARLTGEALARSGNNGLVFRTEQDTRAPYSVSYFVDLRKIGAGDLRWDRENRTMLVRVPDVTVDRPAVDLSRAQVKQRGAWISRRAGIAMQQRGAGYLAQAAERTAQSDEMMTRARAAAVEAVTAYIRQPLAAAGFRDVRVDVLFPWQGYNARERWDESRPVDEVLLNG